MTAFPRRIALFASAILVFAFAGSATAAQQEVLLLLQTSGGPVAETFNDSLAGALRGAPDMVDFYTEVFDVNRFPGAAQEAAFERFLREKYVDHTIDVVVAAGPGPLNFLLARRESLFAGVPVIFAGIRDSTFDSARLSAGMTGVLSQFDIAGTLDLALALQPNTRRVAIVTGVATEDRLLNAFARKRLASYGDRVEFVYLEGLPVNQLLMELGQLPADSIVLYLSMVEDGAGQRFIPPIPLLQRISAAASVPVYGIYEIHIGAGTVGGNVDNFQRIGADAGAMTLRILAGESVDNVPIERIPSANIVDWRQLRRWDLDESKLPVGSVVQFRERTIWGQYKAYILIFMAIVALQALVIGSLLVHRSRLRRAESELRESEARFRTMADSAPVMIWTSDQDRRLIFANKTWHDFTGQEPHDVPDDHWTSLLHHDDLPRFADVYSPNSHAGFSIECRLRRADGEFRWTFMTAVPRLTTDGRFLGFIGSCVDVSDGKKSELEAQQVRRELAQLNRVAAMGELTSSIAHELNQPLSAILHNADAADAFINADPPALADVREIIADIRADNRRAADIIRSLRQFAKRHEIVRQPIEVNGLLQEIVHLVGVEALTRQVAVRLELGEGLPAIAGDRIHLQQVLLNFVLNAFDALSDMPADRRQVVLSSTQAAGKVTLCVADSGKGISPADICQIFEPFYTTKEQGLGLGLAITRTIVHAHDGDIWAERSSLDGAAFFVSIPVFAQPAA